MLPESIKREIKAGKCFYHVNDPYRIHISRVDSDAVVISSCPFLSEQKSEIIPTGLKIIKQMQALEICNNMTQFLTASLKKEDITLQTLKITL